RVKDVGDTNFLVDEQVEKHLFERENERVLERGGRLAIAEPLLLGITKASLSTEAFISASSFQGDDEGADRGGDLRQDGRSSRPQGNCHHEAADPGRDGAARLQAAERRRGGRAVSAGLRAAAAGCACRGGSHGRERRRVVAFLLR